MSQTRGLDILQFSTSISFSVIGQWESFHSPFDLLSWASLSPVWLKTPQETWSCGQPALTQLRLVSQSCRILEIHCQQLTHPCLALKQPKSLCCRYSVHQALPRLWNSEGRGFSKNYRHEAWLLAWGQLLADNSSE